MTDERTKPKDSGDSEEKPKTRIRKFPIRQFSNLLDEFLEQTRDDPLDVTHTVGDLKLEVDQALLKAYKR